MLTGCQTFLVLRYVALRNCAAALPNLMNGVFLFGDQIPVLQHRPPSECMVSSHRPHALPKSTRLAAQAELAAASKSVAPDVARTQLRPRAPSSFVFYNKGK